MCNLWHQVFRFFFFLLSLPLSLFFFFLFFFFTSDNSVLYLFYNLPLLFSYFSYIQRKWVMIMCSQVAGLYTALLDLLPCWCSLLYCTVASSKVLPFWRAISCVDRGIRKEKKSVRIFVLQQYQKFRRIATYFHWWRVLCLFGIYTFYYSLYEVLCAE